MYARGSPLLLRSKPNSTSIVYFRAKRNSGRYHSAVAHCSINMPIGVRVWYMNANDKNLPGPPPQSNVLSFGKGTSSHF
jgi:hypothetical protein